MAIYTDKGENHPQKFEYQFLDTKINYEFRTFEVNTKSEEALMISGNPFSWVMLTVKRALAKNKWSDEEQFTWKKELIIQLKNAGFSAYKIRNVLNFIKFYVKFKQEIYLEQLETNIQITFKQRKSIGIEEDIREHAELLVTVRGILELIQTDLLTFEQIARVFKVNTEFVERVQAGKIYINEYNEVIDKDDPVWE